MKWVDYALGHVVDSLGYDQFYRDHEYTLNQFRIAEKYLNILSGSVGVAMNEKELFDKWKTDPEIDKWFRHKIHEELLQGLRPSYYELKKTNEELKKKLENIR